MTRLKQSAILRAVQSLDQHPAQASYWPDPADGCDSLTDQLAERVAKIAVQLPAGVAKAWFTQTVATIAAAVISEAVQSGDLSGICGATGPTTGDLEAVTRMLAVIMDAEHPDLEAECLAFVLGLNLSGGKSETEIARNHGVGRATVSHRCIQIRKALHLPAGRGMRTDATRETCRQRQTGRRARPCRMEWGMTGIFQRALQ